MDDDLNMPEALASLFDMIRTGNKSLDSGELDAAGAGSALAVMKDMDRVLGLGRKEGLKPGDEIEALVEERQRARANKDWAESDRIRDELAARDWVVKDTDDGPKLTRM
jgi:cysteinyl-tRNA synthetase